MEDNLILRHGTSEASLRTILREGIRPRQSGERGNFDVAIRSVAGHTYLTGPYGLYYADNASPPLLIDRGRISRRNAKRVIIEVDWKQLDPCRFRPDEDMLKQYVQTVRMLGDAAALTRFLQCKPTDDDRQVLQKIVDKIPGGETFVTEDTEAMQELWPYSYELIGSVAYQGIIPPEAIIRYAKIDPFYVPSILRWTSDAQLNVCAHDIIGSELHGALTNLIMDGLPLHEIALHPDTTADLIKDMRSRAWMSVSDRNVLMAQRQKGVKVHDLRPKA